MLYIGEYNELEVVKEVDFGLYLSDSERTEEILLPLKYIPKGVKTGDFINVFLYHDSENRPIATTLEPFATVGEFACMKVVEDAPFGVFVDWGIAKDLLVPLREQSTPMFVGSEYVVYVYLDKETGRVAGSTKWGKYVDNTQMELKEEDPVELLIAERTDLGYNAIVNQRHVGLLYKNDIFEPLQIGDIKKGYVKKVREENKLDLSLQPIGYQHILDAKARLLFILKANNGQLQLGDKSSPEEIYQKVKLSKKAFKKTIGGLYKDRLIEISDYAIKLL